MFEIAAHPAGQGPLHTYKEYLLTATILPAVCAVLWALTALQGLHSTHGGRLGRTGLRIAAIGLLGLAVDSVVTLASGNTDTTGPLYPIAMIPTLIGIVLMAIRWYRAGLPPRWTGPTLAVGWFLGGTPILGSGAAFLILAAAFLAVAIGLHRHEPTRPASVELDSPVTA